MSNTPSYIDQIPLEILAAREKADIETMSAPVEKAIRAIPDLYMHPEVALRIVEALAARMLSSSIYKRDMQESIDALLDDVSAPLYALVKSMEEQ